MRCVFTFDDGLETHKSLAVPCLKSYGFNATFFVTAKTGLWDRFEPEVKESSLEWDEVKDIHDQGFEIGNHTWSHSIGAGIADVEKLEQHLQVRYGIQTRTFCYPAYRITDEMVKGLKSRQYKYARLGYSQGDAMDSQNRGVVDYYTQHETDPLRIYCTGLFGKEADYNYDQFRRDLENVPENSVPVYAFHGLRGLGREEYFERCVQYLSDQGWETVALRDIDG